MNLRSALTCAAWMLCLGLVVLRWRWTDLFGYGENPILLDALCLTGVLALAAGAYACAEAKRVVVVGFAPLLLVSAAPLMFVAATMTAWSVGGFGR